MDGHYAYQRNGGESKQNGNVNHAAKETQASFRKTHSRAIDRRLAGRSHTEEDRQISLAWRHARINRIPALEVRHSTIGRRLCRALLNSSQIGPRPRGQVLKWKALIRDAAVGLDVNGNRLVLQQRFLLIGCIASQLYARARPASSPLLNSGLATSAADAAATICAAVPRPMHIARLAPVPPSRGPTSTATTCPVAAWLWRDTVPWPTSL